MKPLNIIGLQHYVISEDGIIINSLTGNALKQNAAKKGHLRVTLCGNNIRKNFSVHRLVALVYIPNPHNYPFVCHKDNNPKNNHYLNLRWDNNYGNMQDRKLAGRYYEQIGEKNYSHKLTEKEVLQIKELLKSTELTQQLIANKFNISRTTINDIKYHRSWSHLP